MKKPARQPRGSRILIVDPSGEAGSFKVALQIKGYDVAVCGTAQEAISVFCGFEPHTVLVNLPALSGEWPDLLRKLREFPQYQRASFVAIVDPAAPLHASPTLIDHHLPAPLNLAALVNVLAAAVKPAATWRKVRFVRQR